MRLTNLFSGIAATAAATFAATAAFAQAATDNLTIKGAPVDGLMGFQPAASELASDVHRLDTMLLWIVGVITAFVVLLMLIVIVRFNRRANPNPAKFTHNSPLEVAWTVIPIIILVFIGSYSLPALFKQQEMPTGDIVIKVTGHQWYWSYEYVDQAVAFDAFMIGSGEGNLNETISGELAAAGYSDAEFRLATDQAVVVPVGAVILMQVTAADVIHSWAMPAMGVKQDGVPGRLAQLWFQPTEEGIYFGQCSELCGKDHAYMPITLKVVSQEAYDAWLAQAKVDFPA